MLFAIDAAQTSGLVPIDMATMNIDVVCFTGHKSLFGPSGTGGMYIAEHVDITPCRAGGTGVMSALKSQPEAYPWRMEFGTVNLMGVAGLLAAQDWIAARGGVGAIYEHEMRHARRLRDGLADIEGIVLYCADMDRDHLPVFVFNIQGVPADQAGTFLDVEHNVITRTGLHCAPQVHEGIGTFDDNGTVRFSPECSRPTPRSSAPSRRWLMWRPMAGSVVAPALLRWPPDRGRSSSQPEP